MLESLLKKSKKKKRKKLKIQQLNKKRRLRERQKYNSAGNKFGNNFSTFFNPFSVTVAYGSFILSQAITHVAQSTWQGKAVLSAQSENYHCQASGRWLGWEGQNNGGGVTWDFLLQVLQVPISIMVLSK